MPQLDRIIVFSQIFWLFLVFTSLYAILTHFFLPGFLKSLKSRRLIIEINSSEFLTLSLNTTKKQLLLKDLLLKDLMKIESSILREFSSISSKPKLNVQQIDKKIELTARNTSLYCDAQLLNAISLYPKSLNLSFKLN
uniref:ATP synthase F0 subunit 8 n=1 Tax=Mastocarpus papillatus TaxID=31436 RepID=A0A342RZ76_9FLOR|nr:ATP synthase F0 subunit 8 [Mastocarpus papillatus]AOL58022.1 ATP synthase F0 subunit 8 [Mastocarpus papillatus]